MNISVDFSDCINGFPTFFIQIFFLFYHLLNFFEVMEFLHDFNPKLSFFEEQY